MLHKCFYLTFKGLLFLIKNLFRNINVGQKTHCAQIFSVKNEKDSAKTQTCAIEGFYGDAGKEQRFPLSTIVIG